jgi:hypothetical protein
MRTRRLPGAAVTLRASPLVVFLFASSAFGVVHDVPPLKQKGLNDCGPTAAASCIKWFQQNGYPDIKTRGGSNNIDDIKKQIQDDADPKETGAWARKLRDAMNRMINEGEKGKKAPYKNRLRARIPNGNDNAYDDFGFLDSEFSHGENILLLLQCEDENGNPFNHWVTTRNVTGSGTTRTLEYMDPESGTNKSTTVTDGNKELTLTYEDRPAKIVGFVTMSPNNVTDSKSEPVDPNDPSKGTKITYTPRFPAHRKAKDLHVRVKDCTKSNYTVSGLPSGWKWDVHVAADGKCYLSFYADSSTTPLVNGQDIVVIYKGSRKVKPRKRRVHQTIGGSKSPTDKPRARERGVTVCVDEDNPPAGRPEKVACAVMASAPEFMTAMLHWRPVDEPNILEYEIYDENDGDLIAVTPDPFYELLDLEADVTHTFVVVARNTEDLVSEDSDVVMIHHDAMSAMEVVVGGPQALHYRTPLAACFECGEAHRWSMVLPGATMAGNLYMTTIVSEPDAPPPPGMGARHEHMFRLSTDAELVPGPIQLEIPYDANDVVGDPVTMRAFALIGGSWMDVTMAVDPVAESVSCEIPELTTTAVYNLPSGVPGDLDNSGTVDLDNFTLLQGCATGPSVMYDPGMPSSTCILESEGMGLLPADFDMDHDIDQKDFGIFQTMYGFTLLP